MFFDWDYASEYIERSYNTEVDYDAGNFECPHCGYLVYKSHFPCMFLCPHCGARE